MATKVSNGSERIRASIREVKATGVTWEVIGSTLRGWESDGVPDHPQDGPLSDLDALKDWEPGSARAVLLGGQPTPRKPTKTDQTIEALRRIAELAEEAAAALEEDR